MDSIFWTSPEQHKQMIKDLAPNPNFEKMEPLIPRTLFPMDKPIAIGFGVATITKDGLSVYSEGDEESNIMCCLPTGEDAEAFASEDPDHDWRITIFGPLYEVYYQRQGPKEWVLYDRGAGFA